MDKRRLERKNVPLSHARNTKVYQTVKEVNLLN